MSAPARFIPQGPRTSGFCQNLNSTVQRPIYMWVDRLFFATPNPANFMYQLVRTLIAPDPMDTSLVSTDNINNPRTMNAVYNLGSRLEMGRRIAHETLAGGSANNAQFNQFLKQGPLTQYFHAPDQVWTPHVLKDGADSVGALGALNRVYLNIGLFSEDWLTHFNPVARRSKPIRCPLRSPRRGRIRHSGARPKRARPTPPFSFSRPLSPVSSQRRQAVIRLSRQRMRRLSPLAATFLPTHVRAAIPASSLYRPPMRGWAGPL